MKRIRGIFLVLVFLLALMSTASALNTRITENDVITNNITMVNNLTVQNNDTSWVGNLTTMLQAVVATTFYQNGVQLQNLYCLLRGCTMLGDLDMGNNNINNVENISIGDNIDFSNWTIEELPSNGNIVGNVLVLQALSPDDGILPRMILQPGGFEQASAIVRSVMIINDNESFLNNTNRTSCRAYMDFVNETLQIDCNTSITGADLIVGDDMQVIGDVWIKDDDLEWHFLTRTMTELDRFWDDMIFNNLNHTDSVSGGVYNFSFNTKNGETIVINIDRNETITARTGDSITLNNGTQSVPVMNFITYQGKANPTLTVSATHPTAEHADVGRVLMGNVTGTTANVYAWTDSFASTYEFAFGVKHRFYDQGALYSSGFTPNVTATEVNITSGIVVEILDEITTTNNMSLDDGMFWLLSDGTFEECNDLVCLDQYSTGEAIGNNKYYNVIWGIVPNGTNTTRLIAIPQNKPAVEHVLLSTAESDTSFLLFFPGNDLIKKTMLPVARTIIREGTDQNEILSNGQRFFDVRGTTAGAGGNSPSPSITDHGQLAGLTDDDHTQYLLEDGSRGLSGNWNAGSFNITADQFIGNANSSTYWDGYNDTNTTQFENDDGQLHIVFSWLSNLFDALFGAKDTDDLTEGSTNLYDNQTFNETRVGQIAVLRDGSNNLTANWDAGAVNITAQGFKVDDNERLWVGTGDNGSMYFNGTCTIITGPTVQMEIC